MYRIKRKHLGAYSYVEYILNGETHRLDGPALEFNDGSDYWYIHGKEYTYFDWLIEKDKKCSK